MKMNRYYLVGAGLVGLALTGNAKEFKDYLAFSMGSTTFFPRAGITTAYSDNVLFNDTFKISDLVTTVSPGIGIRVGKAEGNHLVIGYNYDHSLYLDHNQYDAQDHRMQIAGNYEGNKLAYTGAASAALLSGVIGGSITDPLLVGGSLKVERWNYRTTHTIDYTLTEKTGIYLTPSFYSIDYEDGTPLYDDQNFTITSGGRFNVTPKTRLHGEVYYGFSSVDGNKAGLASGLDSEVVGGMFGVSFEFTAKLTGTVRTGYESRSFEGGIDAPSEPVVSLGITYRPSLKTTVVLNYVRGSSVSSQGAGESVISDTVSASLTQAIGNQGKYVAMAGISYRTSDYSTNLAANRSFDYFGANLGLGYNFQLWMRASLQYSYTDVSSDSVGVVTYAENRVALTFSVGY